MIGTARMFNGNEPKTIDGPRRSRYQADANSVALPPRCRSEPPNAFAPLTDLLPTHPDMSELATAFVDLWTQQNDCVGVRR